MNTGSIIDLSAESYGKYLGVLTHQCGHFIFTHNCHPLMQKIQLSRGPPWSTQYKNFMSLKFRRLSNTMLFPCFHGPTFILSLCKFQRIFCFVLYILSFVCKSHPFHRTLQYLLSYFDPLYHPGIVKYVKDINTANDSIL